MLPLDLKLRQVSCNYTRFFKKLEKTQMTHPHDHIIPDPLLLLSGKSHWSEAGWEH